MSKISDFVKYQRKKLKLTQAELADKSGVGIRFIRELESGKETLQLNKVDQVLALFGFSITPSNQRLDPYHVRWHLFNIAIRITLADNSEKFGIILKEIIDPVENKITAWKFVTNNNAVTYHQKLDDSLTEIIQHSSISQIEPQ